jgi:hypothetical protein
MGYTAEEIREKLKDLTKAPIQSFWATVVKVDQKLMSAAVDPDDNGAQYSNVTLRADLESVSGITEIPKVGSRVICSILNNDTDTAFISKCTDVEMVVVDSDLIGKANVEWKGDFKIEGSIVLNNGLNQGAVKVLQLVKEMNLIVADITALKALLATLGGIGANAPGAPVLGAVIAPLQAYGAAVLKPVEPATLQNDKLKH